MNNYIAWISTINIENLQDAMNPKIPESVWVISLFVICIIIVVAFHINKDRFWIKKIVTLTLLLEYIFLTLCTTVFCRQTLKEAPLKIKPFWSYSEIVEGNHRLLFEGIMNIILFMPIGLLAASMMKNRSWEKVGLIGIIGSLIIELLQLVLKRGYCEFDDVFHNTVGCVIGYGIYILMTKYISKTMYHSKAKH